MIARKLKSFYIPLFFIVITSSGYAQRERQQFNRDLSPHISLNEFNNRVDLAMNQLKSKKLSAISNSEHINIMMCINTILFTKVLDKARPARVIHASKMKIDFYKCRFIGARYDYLLKIVEGKEYDFNIIKVYPDFKFNRGMGYYFPALNMELKGMPQRYAIFDVANR